jgi:circadian clock protein KaiC
MTSPVTIHRLATGVPGLDTVLGGGLPEFSFNLIAGAPGCGKTTLAHQMMFAMATPQRPTLYLTVLGEPPLKMLRYQQQFSFFDTAAVNQSVRFINLGGEALAGNLDAVLARITAEVQANAPGLVFVDSFRSVVLASDAAGPGEQQVQHFVQALAMLMTSWQATTFLVGEYHSEIDANPVFTISDGILWLRQSEQRNAVVRKLQVMKMRGQASLPGLHPFRIAAAGVEVFPPCGAAPLLALPATPLPTQARMGVPGLDAMLDGGLPRGYSLLVAGPSGSGKSTLASAFLAEGARRGEHGVLAAFEQHPQRARNRQVATLLDAGQVTLLDISAWDLSIEEVVCRLQQAIGRHGASRVVIDSLSGFELALAPSFREDFREALSRMVTALARTGVSVLLTSELEDRYTDLRFSPYGTAFMTDAIIVQRYVEVHSRLRRVMAVVKLRDSRHSDALRLFNIDDDGIRLEDALPEQEGLLSGRPTQLCGLATRPGPAQAEPLAGALP